MNFNHRPIKVKNLNSYSGIKKPLVLLRMYKTRFVGSVVCVVLVFILVFNPHNFAQATNTSVTVLSHSSYVSPSGHFVVLGEVQNTGSHALESVSLSVEVTASDGAQIAEGTSDVFVHNFLPQQKAPFYLDFGKIDFNIVSKTSAFNISLANAPPTNYIQYPDLYLNMDSDGITKEAYTVSGSITNTGNQTANDIEIYGTYYNSAGVVVAVGLVSLKDPLAPTTSANFTLSENDESIKLSTKISSYALLAQTSTKVFSLPPSTSPSDIAQSSDSSWLTSAIIGIIAIAVIGVLVLVFLKRKHTSPIVSTHHY
jgi:hypothetical protein